MDALAVVLAAPEALALNRLPITEPGEADIAVAVEWSGISTGTERLLWSGRMPDFPGMGYPLVPGYEAVGRVERAGPRSGVQVGERVFVPGARCFGEVRGLFGAAASRLVARGQLEQLLAGGLHVISCGANVPFADPEIFFGPTGEFADQHTAVIPDFIANCGMARVFAYLMETGAEITDQAIFSDTSRIIGAALERTRQHNPQPTGIAQCSFEMALRQLV